MRANVDSEEGRGERAETDAVRWFARQQSSTWTEEDQAQFGAWLEAATAHRIQYLRVSTAWEHAARMKALGAGVAPGEVPERGSWGDARFSKGTVDPSMPASVLPAPGLQPTTAEPVRKPGPGIGLHHPEVRWHARFLATAASVIAVAIGASVYIGLFSGDRYSTPIGGVENVPLADGSKVTLNTNTSIRVSLSDHERRVQLDRGEAFFEVAKDRSRPFVVYAGDKRVVAVGTKFSVRRENGDVQVVVTEGRVNLAAAEIASAPPGTPGAGAGSAEIAIPSSTFLDAGAIARTSHREVLVRKDAAADAERLLSWRRGYVSFDNVALADAAAEFNRYNTRKIVIADPAIAAIRVGGNFRSDNSDAFLALIQSGFPIVVEQDGDRVVLKGR